MSERQKILIVDDSPQMIKILSRILGMDWDICCALGGLEALQIVNEVDVDLMLLDIVMPGIDGYEVLTRLREIPRGLTLPVICVTSMGQADSETRGLDLGACDYITKPFNQELVRLRGRNRLALKKTSDLLEKRTIELEQNLKKVRLLSGMLPICSSCKKIRDDKGYWEQIETYIAGHSEAEFTHGICPGCVKLYFPELKTTNEPEKEPPLP